MIVIVCIVHKKAWFLSAHGENNEEAASLDGHFNHQEGGLWSSECEPRVLPVGEPGEGDPDSQSGSGNS